MNKEIIIVLFALVILASCTGSDQKKETFIDSITNPLTAEKDAKELLMPKIKLESDVYDFLEITEGESVSTEFILENIGEAPLLIRSAKGSCGCTVPEWPTEPILAGESGTIKVTFNSTGKKGRQNKTVTLVTNAIPNTKVLRIIGNILVLENK
ncbi:MAG: hypothetical protein CMD16_04180 [Flavobacteriales bacterium]|nr:hypothetical protein [Flavobacteriales bacterium]|tara:strand:- start:31596 stop:32057 length:462 start_codon:yes stop_codon:yes gene_type:complete